MICDNCKKREANICYSENINGKRKEMHLCEECSKKLGIAEQMNFNMGLDFSSLFGGIFENLADFTKPDFMPILNEMHSITCKTCGLSFDDIVNNGRLGCPNCYETFETRLDPILKRIQGSNRHIGRLGTISENNIDMKDKQEKQKNEKEDTKESKKEKLEKELKLAIKEERYEDAARNKRSN